MAGVHFSNENRTRHVLLFWHYFLLSQQPKQQWFLPLARAGFSAFPPHALSIYIHLVHHSGFPMLEAPIKIERVQCGQGKETVDF